MKNVMCTCVCMYAMYILAYVCIHLGWQQKLGLFHNWNQSLADMLTCFVLMSYRILVVLNWPPPMSFVCQSHFGNLRWTKIMSTVQVEKSHIWANSCVNIYQWRYLAYPGINRWTCLIWKPFPVGFPKPWNACVYMKKFGCQAVESFGKVPQPLQDLIKPDIVPADSGSKALTWLWISNLEAMYMFSWTRLDSFFEDFIIHELIPGNWMLWDMRVAMVGVSPMVGPGLAHGCSTGVQLCTVNLTVGQAAMDRLQPPLRSGGGSTLRVRELVILWWLVILWLLVVCYNGGGEVWLSMVVKYG